MKSANCISHTGRSPSTAAPTAVAMIALSASGLAPTPSVPNPAMEPPGAIKPPPERLDLVPARGETLLVALDRVARVPLLEHLLRHVAHVVVRPVAVHAHRLGLNQRRPVASSGPLAGRRGSLEDGLHVVAVHLLAGKPVDRRSL